MRRWLAGAILLSQLSAAASAEDAGRAKSGAAFLNYSMSARAAGMGEAQTAVATNDATGLYSNPALLASLDRASFATTTGALGYDRSIYSVAASLPFYWGMGQGFFFKTRQNHKEADSGYQNYLMDTPEKRLVISAGATLFRIDDIQARSDFGADQGTFQDIERAFYLSLSFLVYKNLTLGLTGKILSQSLENASAHATTADVGIAYQLPRYSFGTLAFALTGRDLGDSLTWSVTDPRLEAEYEYSEPLSSKMIAGASYTSANEKWLFAVDAINAEREDLNVRAGLEWRFDHRFQLRVGSNSYDPTVGLGFGWPLRTMDLKADYAFQYSLEDLDSPHWFSLSLAFRAAGAAPEKR
jgi:hypothetical protein